MDYFAFGSRPLPGTDLYLEPAAHTRCLAFAFRACPVLARECGPDHPVVVAEQVRTYEMRRFYAPDQDVLTIYHHGDRGGHDTPLHLYLSQPLRARVLDRDSFVAISCP